MGCAVARPQTRRRRGASLARTAPPAGGRVVPAGPDLGAARRRRQIRARWLLGIGAAVILLGLDMVSEGADGGLVVMVYGVLALCAAAVARRRSGG